MKNYKYLDVIIVIFVTILLVSNIVSTKITDLGIFVFDAGTLIFPLSYIFGDVLTEVYGYKTSRKVIWLWFLASIVMSVIIIIVWFLPPANDRAYQQDYINILWMTPRIVWASLIAYFVWEFSNSFILAKMKIWTKWKYLRTRTIWSTLIWESFDTAIFVLVAFWWVLPSSLILTMVISNYIFKVWIEIFFTPITYKIVNFLKKKENEDFFDYETNFNPFLIKK